MWLRKVWIHLPPFSRAVRIRRGWGRKTKKPLAGARGLRAGLRHGVHCRGGCAAVQWPLRTGALLPIIIVVASTPEV
ncbi:hypothetical protein BN2537_5471 [Streptomyces venezuelae]|nr:hypothetical protein BN2537_5471 [Streptomyces venezuelae]